MRIASIKIKTMNEKEKAKELVDKFKEFADEDYMDTKQQFDLNETRKLNAKECAKIAVEEILKELPEYHPLGPYDNPRIDFYEQVLKEIDLI